MIYVICFAIFVEKEVIIYWNEVYHHFKTKQLFSPVAKGLGLYFWGHLVQSKVVASDGYHDNDDNDDNDHRDDNDHSDDNDNDDKNDTDNL